jgi:hypothetical protein
VFFRYVFSVKSVKRICTISVVFDYPHEWLSGPTGGVDRQEHGRAHRRRLWHRRHPGMIGYLHFVLTRSRASIFSVDWHRFRLHSVKNDQEGVRDGLIKKKTSEELVLYAHLGFTSFLVPFLKLQVKVSSRLGFLVGHLYFEDKECLITF